MMRLLVACEFSGIVRDSFKLLGWDAWSCDLLPTKIAGNHYQCDIFQVINMGWDLMIAHPPCTYLANSSVSHLYNNKHKTDGIDLTRWSLMEQAAEFFVRILNTSIQHVAIENPVMHGYAKERIGVQQSQVVHPWQFGHMEKKATCLWLRNLPLLEPTQNVYAEMMLLPKNVREHRHYLPPSPDRWALRSETYQGIADAMAQQWTKALGA
jgi:hypothetical protein